MNTYKIICRLIFNFYFQGYIVEACQHFFFYKLILITYFVEFEMSFTHSSIHNLRYCSSFQLKSSLYQIIQIGFLHSVGNMSQAYLTVSQFQHSSTLEIISLILVNDFEASIHIKRQDKTTVFCKELKHKRYRLYRHPSIPISLLPPRQDRSF